MTDKFFDYDVIVSDALRGVMRKILDSVAESGLPAGHHFYITFKTGDEGVCVSDAITAQYPEEMTIVLQHRFWGLKVEDDRFEVGLSFNQRPETIIIPYQAVVAFVDPSAEFALQFEEGLAMDESGDLRQADMTNLSALESSPGPKAETVSDDETAKEADIPPENKVVTLDAFRKKR